MTQTNRLGVHWLSSYPKSGNTWARCLIDALLLGRVDINRLTIVRSDTIKGMYQAITRKPVADLSADEQALLRPAALHNLACCWNFELCEPIVKTHWQYRKNVEPLTLPSVYLIRDPRDVAVSLARHDDALDINLAIQAMSNPAMLWNKDCLFQRVGGWSDHVRSWEGKATVVKYEEFDAAKVAETLGVAGDIEAALDLCSIEKMREQEKANGFQERYGKERFFGPAKSRWKDVLSKAQADAIVADHKETMDRYGYI